MWDILSQLGAAHGLLWSDAQSGLRAVLVIDDVTLGPAAGGIRTWQYGSDADAVREAANLARAMTLKCSLSGIPAGGGKVVVLAHPQLQREAAFAVLGQRVEELGGLFRTAGDLGTTAHDLSVMARHTRFVYAQEGVLAQAVARGMVRCITACVKVQRRTADLGGLRVAVQGAGAIGAAVVRALCAAGARVLVADINTALAARLAEETDATQVGVKDILFSDVDVLAPCAIGRVVDERVARELRAWALCGAANDILTDARAAQVLTARKVLHVPDAIASAGAVIEGVGTMVMGLSDRNPLIDRLEDTAREVLEESRATGKTALQLATDRAWARIERQRATRRQTQAA